MTIWDAIAKCPIEDVKESILAGYKHGKPWEPDQPKIQWFCHTVLDFGMGLGRNWPMLLSRADLVIGYDRPEMVRRYQQEYPVPERVIVTDQLNSYAVGVVYASLVLQHIDVQQAILDMPKHRYLHVVGRARHDAHSLGTFAQIPLLHYKVLQIGDHLPWPTVSHDTSDAHYEVLFERIGWR